MCQKKTFYVDVNAFLPKKLMILKADISKTSHARHLFLYIFMCGNSKCTRIQKIKKFSGEVNWVLLAVPEIVNMCSAVLKKLFQYSQMKFEDKTLPAGTYRQHIRFSILNENVGPAL